MRRMTLVAALGAVALAGPALAQGLGEAGEAEAARANARAGGPTNAHDARLLERYGCLSGTNSEFCRRLDHRGERHRRRRHRQDE